MMEKMFFFFNWQGLMIYCSTEFLSLRACEVFFFFMKAFNKIMEGGENYFGRNSGIKLN